MKFFIAFNTTLKFTQPIRCHATILHVNEVILKAKPFYVGETFLFICRENIIEIVIISMVILKVMKDPHPSSLSPKSRQCSCSLGSTSRSLSRSTIFVNSHCLNTQASYMMQIGSITLHYIIFFWHFYVIVFLHSFCYQFTLAEGVGVISTRYWVHVLTPNFHTSMHHIPNSRPHNYASFPFL